MVNEAAILSAIARPYHGYHRLIYQKAAALLHGIVSNHGFVDGNKRTALYLVELMVQRSDYEFVEDDMEIVDTIKSVARGETSYEELAEWFRERLVRPRK
ncbi:MAG: type II toxin-antitoxin system death-on-curing family toxin [Candidatus Tectomicrobia bacterium]|nr:type II toxin-antitoxin system death-on-curing family toxin [Candidatus Tectomicrobia bacterium]